MDRKPDDEDEMETSIAEGEGEEEFERAVEPERMSWFVVAFMAMCLFMTAAMAYYAWEVFARAV